MKYPKKTKEKAEKTKVSMLQDEENVCFVISPIGKSGTEDYNKFKEVFDYVIKPAVKNSGYKLKVIRADDIERAGSFIKDILQNLLDSLVVIADLTGKNPNVFYELGVRHSLSSRTILISQSIEDIPSDLREYRTIIYDTTAKGAVDFQKRLTKYLEEIYEEPNRPDNPVQDRLGSIVEQNKANFERENLELKKQIESFLKKGVIFSKPVREEYALTRVKRIIDLIDAQRTFTSPFFTIETGEIKRTYFYPSLQGEFNLFSYPRRGKPSVLYYFAIIEGDVRWDRNLADVRVLMQKCSEGINIPCIFIIATNEDLKTEKKNINEVFNKMKSFVKEDQRGLFSLEIWDKTGLIEKEKELGIKIDI